jgi:cytochrome c oxidase cbb3-type subunit III
MARNIEKDHVTGTDTTGHEWDGIKELNTPLPRWWLWTFYATVVWSVGYVIAYPAIPLISSNTKGLLGYSSRADVAAAVSAAKEGQKQWLDKISAASLEDIVKDPELLQFARAGGAAAFKVNCVQCHGAGAAGSAGYPNLNDDDWIWGGTLDQIHTTLVNGIRVAGNDDTRVSEMPAFGGDADAID